MRNSNSNGELQKHIVSYAKTRQTYTEYRKGGYSKKFRAEHEADILLHQTAKKVFDELGYGKDKKLPTVKTLRAGYAAKLEEKRTLNAEYRKEKAAMRELLLVKENVDRLLGTTERGQDRDTERSNL